MFNLSYFERLIETVTLLVRHPEYPNKQRVLEQSRSEVTELIRAGRISVPEAEMLFEILDTYPLIPAHVMSGVGNGCSTRAGVSASR
jgi:hypothetical protein